MEMAAMQCYTKYSICMCVLCKYGIIAGCVNAFELLYGVIQVQLDNDIA